MNDHTRHGGVLSGTLKAMQPRLKFRDALLQGVIFNHKPLDVHFKADSPVLQLRM